MYGWEGLGPDEKTWLSGYLAYCKSVEPDFINRLCKKYGYSAITQILGYD